MTKPLLGLLPLFAGLYDKMDPDTKFSYAPFIGEVTARLEQSGIDVLPSPVCVHEPDIAGAIARFEEQGADAVGVLFLAYHPSLDSAGPLSQTDLPLIMLDTTQSEDFNPQTDPALVLHCHGIHGVQDLCCVLQRLGKRYEVAAGYYEDPRFAQRTLALTKAAAIARRFTQSRVGIIGAPFEKMGDFALPFDKLQALTGIQTLPFPLPKAAQWREGLTREEIDGKIAENAKAFQVDSSVDTDCARAAAITDAVLCKWLQAEKLNAFTFNFLDFNGNQELPAVPFAAASRLMGEGIGYAGEGDVLTAALTGALLSAYPESSFCEMFCPDWSGGSVYMGHMGEINVRAAVQARLLKKNIEYIKGLNNGDLPTVAALFKPGEAVLVNLAPLAGDMLRLTLVPCTMDAVEGENRFCENVHGWLRPPMDIPQFLERYSADGGTHHSCLCYGADFEVLKAAGRMLGWDVNVIS